MNEIKTRFVKRICERIGFELSELSIVVLGLKLDANDIRKIDPQGALRLENEAVELQAILDDFLKVYCELEELEGSPKGGP